MLALIVDDGKGKLSWKPTAKNLTQGEISRRSRRRSVVRRPMAVLRKVADA